MCLEFRKKVKLALQSLSGVTDSINWLRAENLVQSMGIHVILKKMHQVFRIKVLKVQTKEGSF